MKYQVIRHEAPKAVCIIHELVPQQELPKFPPIFLRFTSLSKNRIKFEVENRTSKETFEYTLTNDVDGIAKHAVECLETIFDFYGIGLDKDDKMCMIESMKLSARSAEKFKGNSVQNYNDFQADTVMVVSTKISYSNYYEKVQ